MPGNATADNRPGAALNEQATKKKRGRRGGRRRGKSAEIARQINAKAETRRKIWRDVGQDGPRSNEVEKLTADINGRENFDREGLYFEGRVADAGTMEPGNQKVSQAFPLLHEYGKRTASPGGES